MSDLSVNPENLPSPSSPDEVVFNFNELFFSRTDDRGIILSGNDVFQRISMYSWHELLNKPHNLIRHPDMPKAVFWLLWDTIRQGHPIGAYVKNRAKDGRYYWVFAIVTPIEGGYLSVRLKPGSPIMDVVGREYAGLRSKELSTRLKPAESGALLLARLQELGFPDYRAFMATALNTEIATRNEKLGRPKDLQVDTFGQLLGLSASLLKKAEIIFNAYSINEYVPLNLRVKAAKLGESGRTIGVISDNYTVISDDIRDGMHAFTTAARQVDDTIKDGLFLVGTAKIQREVWQHFNEESSQKNTTDNDHEISLLAQQQAAYHQKATDGLVGIEAQARKFRESCFEMKRLVAALEVTRVMGKVETARLEVTEDGLNELIDDLEVFQTTLTTTLKEIEDLNREVQVSVDALLKRAG